MPKWLSKSRRKGESFTHSPGTFSAWSVGEDGGTRPRSTEGDESQAWGQHSLHPSKYPQLTVDTVCADLQSP
jgi:hypothetical protein